MSSPFLAEIRIVGFNFAPVGWAFCNGQLMPISQNTALFSLLGTQYGGDGKSTFALPNFQGSGALGQGTGPGLTPRTLGEIGGEAAVSLSVQQMPGHTHTPRGNGTGGSVPTPNGNALGVSPEIRVYNAGPPDATLSPSAVGISGGNQAHNNMPPFLTLNFIIALQGIFPARA